MALQKTITSTAGLEVQNAYIKINEYSCGEENIVNARIRAYVSRELEQQGASHLEGTEEIITLTADYSDDAINTKKQIYEYMKTLEKYTDAIDVIEESSRSVT